jgi:hypothetical protein
MHIIIGICIYLLCGTLLYFLCFDNATRRNNPKLVLLGWLLWPVLLCGIAIGLLFYPIFDLMDRVKRDKERRKNDN